MLSIFSIFLLLLSHNSIITNQTKLNKFENNGISDHYLDINSNQATSRVRPAYFEKLSENFSNNYDGSCTLIAAEIALSYYDTYLNDDIVSEEYEFKAEASTSVLSSFTQSPGSGKGNDRPLVDELIDIADDFGYFDLQTDHALSHLELRNVIENYFYNNNLDAYTAFSFTKSFITTTIDGGDPIIISLNDGGDYGHTVVAYGYNDDYVWIHTGQNSLCKAISWSYVDYYANYSIKFSFGCLHKHSDNFKNITTNQYICPLHGVFKGDIDIYPADFGFRERYVDPYETDQFSVYPLSFNTQRYRCGYIQQEFVNISPKKYYYGQAYLMCYFHVPITSISFDLSYWSAQDVLNPADSTAELIFEDYADETWDYNSSINLLNCNLPTNRNNQTTYTYNFSSSNRISGFYLRATAPAVGDRNLGRISIGHIHFTYDIGVI